MRELLIAHSFAIIAISAYVFSAAVANLPDGKFEFYPWFRGTLRSLANHVPARYQTTPNPTVAENR